MTADPTPYRRRTLISGAKTAADIVRAAQLVHQYIEGGFTERASGRTHGVVYGPKGATALAEHAYVWHTAHQITVHLGGG